KNEKLSRRNGAPTLGNALWSFSVTRWNLVRVRKLGSQKSLQKQIAAHAGDKDAGKHAKERINAVRQHILLRVERDCPEQVDARCVGNRHDKSEEERVAWCAPGSDQISRDDRLTVARLQRMQSTESGSNERGQQDSTHA